MLPCLVRLNGRKQTAAHSIECVLLRITDPLKPIYCGFVTTVNGEDKLRAVCQMYLPADEYKIVRPLSGEEVTLLMLKHTT